MEDLETLAVRLAECADAPSAAEALVEQVRRWMPRAAVRLYRLGPGDRCGACPWARECDTRDRCLHLEATGGGFSLPPGLAERIPRTSPGWERALAGNGTVTPETPPAALAADEAGDDSTWLLPLRAGGRIVGVFGVRLAPDVALPDAQRLQVAALLAGSALHVLESAAREHERLRHLVLVGEIGRKVTAILDDELLLKQAVEDIRRTFSFHNVMIFLRGGDAGSQLVMAARASRAGAPLATGGSVDLAQGIVGRCYRSGETEVVSDVSRDPDFVRWFADTRAEIAVPIRVSNEVAGVLNVESDQADRFGASERLVLETIASEIAIALENARLFKLAKQREDRYRVLVDANPGAVLYLDARGEIVFANPAAEELTGQSPAALVGPGQTLVALSTEAGRPDLEGAVHAALTGERRSEVRFDVLHASGDVRHVEALLQPLGEGRGAIVLAWDRTREWELQDRLRQSEKLSAIGSLVSGVAHELNNPLASVLGYAQLMLSRAPESWARKDLENIEENARRCRAIVENLLTFARQGGLTRRLVKVHEIIEGVLGLNEYQFHVDDIEIERDFDLRVPPLYLDVNRWQQVFVNLVANARQAMVEADAGRRVLRFETRLEGDSVAIRVLDTGPGIPEKVRSRIFEPFFTTKEGGTGLGLGICFGIVSEHGGEISLESSEPGRTGFLIRVPRETRSVAAPPERARSTPLAADVGAGRRVLVVDDEPHVRDVVQRALEAHGFDVQAVGDGTTALERVQDGGFHVVITDVSMPGRTKGLELYDRIEEIDRDLARRVIFLTGHLHDDVLASQIESRGGRCVEKPFEIHTLVQAVNDVADTDAPDDPP